MELVRLHTVTGSVYEFDVAGRRVRRLGNHGGSAPTPHIARDGAWHPLRAIALHATPDGVRAQLLWRLDENVLRSTLLSAALDPRELEALDELLLR